MPSQEETMQLTSLTRAFKNLSEQLDNAIPYSEDFISKVQSIHDQLSKINVSALKQETPWHEIVPYELAMQLGEFYFYMGEWEKTWDESPNAADIQSLIQTILSGAHRLLTQLAQDASKQSLFSDFISEHCKIIKNWEEFSEPITNENKKDGEKALLELLLKFIGINYKRNNSKEFYRALKNMFLLLVDLQNQAPKHPFVSAADGWLKKLSEPEEKLFLRVTDEDVIASFKDLITHLNAVLADEHIDEINKKELRTLTSSLSDLTNDKDIINFLFKDLASSDVTMSAITRVMAAILASGTNTPTLLDFKKASKEFGKQAILRVIIEKVIAQKSMYDLSDQVDKALGLKQSKHAQQEMYEDKQFEADIQRAIEASLGLSAKPPEFSQQQLITAEELLSQFAIFEEGEESEESLLKKAMALSLQESPQKGIIQLKSDFKSLLDPLETCKPYNKNFISHAHSIYNSLSKLNVSALNQGKTYLDIIPYDLAIQLGEFYFQLDRWNESRIKSSNEADIRSVIEAVMSRLHGVLIQLIQVPLVDVPSTPLSNYIFEYGNFIKNWNEIFKDIDKENEDKQQSEEVLLDLLLKFINMNYRKNNPEKLYRALKHMFLLLVDLQAKRPHHPFVRAANQWLQSLTEPAKDKLLHVTDLDAIAGFKKFSKCLDDVLKIEEIDAATKNKLIKLRAALPDRTDDKSISNFISKDFIDPHSVVRSIVEINSTLAKKIKNPSIKELDRVTDDEFGKQLFIQLMIRYILEQKSINGIARKIKTKMEELNTPSSSMESVYDTQFARELEEAIALSLRDPVTTTECRIEQPQASGENNTEREESEEEMLIKALELSMEGRSQGNNQTSPFLANAHFRPSSPKAPEEKEEKKDKQSFSFDLNRPS